MSQNLTLASLPTRLAAERGDHVALTDAHRTLTYGELAKTTARVANALRALDVAPGTRVAFLTKDSVDTYEAILGVARAGAVVLGINWRLRAKEIRFILNDGRAEVVFVDPEHLPVVLGLLDELPRIRSLILFGEGASGALSYGTWRDAAPDTDPVVTPDREDIAVQMYTSGTTGHPKGVQLAHRSFFAITESLSHHGDPWIGWNAHDVSLLTIPSFHIGGLWWAVVGLASGAKNVVLEAFVAWRILDAIPAHRVTKICLVPAMIQVLLTEPGCRTTDFSSLQHIVYGGSPIPRSLLREAMAIFGCKFAQIYGLTETGNTAVCLRPEDHRLDRPDLLAAAGRPYPGVRLEIRDEAGKPVPPAVVGEVCIESPANMVGYWNRPEATAKTLVSGWILTGDAGFLDEAGFLHISDRLKDMIIYAGENIYPAEIESVLSEHPAVAEVGVIGIPDERWGETVKALCVLRKGCEGTESELLEHCRSVLADFKVPKSVEFVENLPRTPSGKIKKAELREPYWRGRERRVN